MSKIHHDALAAAARDALQAPSVFNTQPWRWRIDGDALELRADRDRQLTVADPDGRLLLLSCGAALHHVRVALAAAGWGVRVRRLVETFADDFWPVSTWRARTGPSRRTKRCTGRSPTAVRIAARSGTSRAARGRAAAGHGRRGRGYAPSPRKHGPDAETGDRRRCGRGARVSRSGV